MRDAAAATAVTATADLLVAASAAPAAEAAAEAAGATRSRALRGLTGWLRLVGTLAALRLSNWVKSAETSGLSTPGCVWTTWSACSVSCGPYAGYRRRSYGASMSNPSAICLTTPPQGEDISLCALDPTCPTESVTAGSVMWGMGLTTLLLAAAMMVATYMWGRKQRPKISQSAPPPSGIDGRHEAPISVPPSLTPQHVGLNSSRRTSVAAGDGGGGESRLSAMGRHVRAALSIGFERIRSAAQSAFQLRRAGSLRAPQSNINARGARRSHTGSIGARSRLCSATSATRRFDFNQPLAAGSAVGGPARDERSATPRARSGSMMTRSVQGTNTARTAASVRGMAKRPPSAGRVACNDRASRGEPRPVEHGRPTGAKATKQPAETGKSGKVQPDISWHRDSVVIAVDGVRVRPDLRVEPVYDATIPDHVVAAWQTHQDVVPSARRTQHARSHGRETR